MHLKSLRLQGFKTFARRTELPFSRGITAIVGPNGSGKSNLVDAIRWALGERNARGLRGHRMEDVIYSGGPGKSAVGMAEVAIVIDNADQRLSVEFNEIEISRRLFRSGESEYLINGAHARLRDIDVLLASTGLRQDGYAVTAQNDIDFVIQAAPDVRRELIEEAAGVRRVRDQRQEALNRLAEAERDMRRARDILDELSPRAAELRVQAAAAEEYQRVADALRALQGSLARDAWRKAMVQLRRAIGRRQTAEQKRTAATQAVADFEPIYAGHRSALLAARDARWRHQEAVADLRLRLAESQHQARIAEERGAAARQALSAVRQELERLGASEQAGSRVVDELARAVDSAQTELDATAAELRDAIERERTARGAQAALEREHADRQQQRQELQRERAALDADLRQLDGRLQFLKEQQQQARNALDSWSVRHGSLIEELARRRRMTEEGEAELQQAITASSTVEQRLTAAQAAFTAAEQAVVTHETRIRALMAEVGALRTLLDHAQRQSPLQGRDGWRRLGEFLEVDPEDRVVVEAALEGWLDGWLAVAGEQFDGAIAIVAATAHARESVLRVPESLDSFQLPVGVRPVASLVKAPDRVMPVVAHLCHDAVLATDRDEARRLVTRHPQLRAVTPAGEVLTAAAYRGGKGADAALEVHARLRVLEQELNDERQAAQQAAETVAIRAAGRTTALEAQAGALARVDAARTRTAQAAGALAAAGEAVQREAQQETQVRQQFTRISGLLAQAEHGQADRLDRAAACRDAEAAAAREATTLEQRNREADTGLTGATEQRQAIELRAALARQRSDDLRRQLERAREVWQSHGNELAQRRAAAEELVRQPESIDGERQRWLDSAEELQAELASLESAHLPDAETLASLEAQLHTDEQRNVTLQVELAHAEDGFAVSVSEQEAAQAEVDRCAAALHDGGQQVNEADPVEEVDWQKTEREVSRLQRRLDAMGAVNLLAPDEYAQLRERCDSLSLQLSDLEAAAAQLTALRQRLEEEIDGRFRTVFQSVAVNFQEFFSELFEGGRATLRLEARPDGNPLDDGVEILAQTPGKRLQPLTLLSGGERALTALAFLFALQAVTPSPFYVLDEVDAALDDANVVRFNRVLKRLAADQQFLIVTHNHSTMAQAEVLYGVTLGDHGISRMVSVRLHQDTLMPVAERTA